MGANKTDEIKKTSYKEGGDYKTGGFLGRSQSPRYDNDEGGETGWFTHVNNLPGRQKARKA